MARKWLVRTAAVAALLALAGCRAWCERRYGTGCCCPTGYAPAPQCCCPPPCCTPTSYAPPPPPAPAGTWNQPRGGCTCP